MLIGEVWIALLTIVVRCRDEVYIVQLDFKAALDRLSHSGLLFKLKSIGEGGNVLSICREFLSNRRQRVFGDGAASEWIPLISGVP